MQKATTAQTKKPLFKKRGCEFKTPDSERMQSVVDQSCDGSGCRMISRRKRKRSANEGHAVDSWAGGLGNVSVEDRPTGSVTKTNPASHTEDSHHGSVPEHSPRASASQPRAVRALFDHAEELVKVGVQPAIQLDDSMQSGSTIQPGPTIQSGPTTQPGSTTQPWVPGVPETPSCSEQTSACSPNPAAHLQQEMEEDILTGLCPEDLDFTIFNCSKLSNCSAISSPPLASPTHLQPPCPAQLTPNASLTPPPPLGSVTCHSTPTKRPVVDVDDFFDLASFEGDMDILAESSRNVESILLSPGCQDAKVVAKSHDAPGELFYGLSLEVQQCLEKERGIKKLYEWQDACLRLESVSQGKNLIYSSPTSGGKTLVAEILIFQQAAVKKKDVLLILPYVSIVQEKVRDLLPFAPLLGFAVEEYAGSKGRIPPKRRRRKRVVYVATIEKATGLTNSLIEDGRMDSIGLVVVDELHMLGEGGARGATLEVCLAKIMFASGNTQVIGMSATLSNMAEVAQFLKAEVYTNNFRPVKLCEHIKMGCGLYSIAVEKDHSVHFNHVRSISCQSQSKGPSSDPDQLCSLVLEVIPHSSCLVFCPTKRNCQNVALLLSTSLPRPLAEVNRESRLDLLKLLSIEASGVCPILAQTIPYGIAYHHSGLTSDERRAIEEAYLQGTLCLLTCTSTLAAGVNLPAKRVILRSPYVGTQLISHSQYKQMVGRAGRSGLCESGDSILVLQPSEKEKVVAILSSPFNRCVSSLGEDGSHTLHSLLLSVVGLKLVGNSKQLWGFLEHTLQWVQLGEERLLERSKRALDQLAMLGYITMVEEGDTAFYTITRLGTATYKGCLPVDTAHQTYTEGLKTQSCLVLSTDLHLLYLATPPDIAHTLQPNWMMYFQAMTRGPADDLRVAEQVGVGLGLLSKMATGMGAKMSPQLDMVYRRLYLALILKALLVLKSSSGIWSVAERFSCSRGFLQNTLHTVAAYISCLVRFTEELPELWALHLLLPSLSKRLTHFACMDLVPLLEIPGMKQGRAQQLFSAGIRTPQQLACLSVGELCEMVEYMYPGSAAKLIQASKALVAEQVEALYEEAEELMDPRPSHPS